MSTVEKCMHNECMGLCGNLIGFISHVVTGNAMYEVLSWSAARVHVLLYLALFNSRLTTELQDSRTIVLVDAVPSLLALARILSLKVNTIRFIGQHSILHNALVHL